MIKSAQWDFKVYREDIKWGIKTVIKTVGVQSIIGK